MKRSLAVTLILLGLCNPSYASFYVDNDAPVQTAIDSQPTTRQVSLDLSFLPKHALLSAASRVQLNDQAATARDAQQISIVVSAAKTINPLLTKQRVDAIKQWLSNNRASASVEVIEDSEPRPKELADVVTLSMTVRLPARAAPISPARAVLASYAPPRQEPLQVAVAPTQPLISDQTKIALLQRIVMMGKSKLVKPEDAFNLVVEVLDMQDAASPQAGPSALSRGTAGSPSVAQLVAPEVPRQWSLDPSKSLSANLTDWSRMAGWEAPDWAVPEQYQVGAATLNGTFYEALDQVANAVPTLDFTINKQRRTLRIEQAH